MTTGSVSFTSRTNRQKTVATVFILAASLLGVHLLFWLFPNVFEPWNSQTLDQLFALRSVLEIPRPQPSSPILHVDITDRTLRRLRNSYQTRADYARVVRNLADMGITAQMWDFIFAARTNALDDSLLLQSTSYAGTVYLGMAFDLSERPRAPITDQADQEEQSFLEAIGWNLTVEGNEKLFPQSQKTLLTFYDLAAASKGLGFLNVNADRDGIYRRVPLLVRYEGLYYPSIVLRMVCDYLNVAPENIQVRSGHAIVLKGARRQDEEPHDIVIPVDEKGNMVVNFIGAWEAMKHIDFADVFFVSDDRFEMELMAEELAGSLVVVSQVTTGSADVGPVPTDPNFPKSGIHANALRTILAEDFIRELSPTIATVIELALVVLLFICASRFSSLWLSVSIVALLLVFTAGAVLLFLYGNLIVNTVRPSLVVVISLIAIVAYRYIYEEKEKEVLRRAFEAYFPPAVVKKIVANPEMVTTSGQKKELTVMFSDIKSFTTHSTRFPPDQIQSMLSEYFGVMMDVAFKHGGTVDKLIGDGLMVFFGDPENQPDHAVRCVRAAVEMQEKARTLEARWNAEGKMPLKIRIGINTGEVVVGNMGSSRRLTYTVLGPDVNLAQRLEASAPVGGILISERTYQLVKNHVPVRPLGAIPVKGLEKAIPVYEVELNKRQ